MALRADGSRECAPDDGLRKAIQEHERDWRASPLLWAARTSHGMGTLFLAMTAAAGVASVGNAVYSVFERSVERFAVHENASKYKVRTSVLIQSEPIRP